MVEPFSLVGKKVWIAGHKGMVGSAIVRRLKSEACEFLTVDREAVDLTRQAEVECWLDATRPDVVFLAAAKVGGIFANMTRPAEFLWENIAIESNVIHGSYRTGVKKLLFLGSSCIYPKFAQQPIKEDALLTGSLEPTSEWYALAKIAGIKMCQAYRRQYNADFISAMPTNLYGLGDCYDLEQGHVVAALIMKIETAKRTGADVVKLWGTGTPKREFLFVDDLADGLVFLMKHYSADAHVNIGTGREVTILELAQTIARIAGWHGSFSFDISKPDGTPRKLMDTSVMRSLGWVATTSLEAGMAHTYEAYCRETCELLAATAVSRTTELG